MTTQSQQSLASVWVLVLFVPFGFLLIAVSRILQAFKRQPAPTPSPQLQQMEPELPFDDNELDNGVFDPELIKDGYDPDHLYVLDWLDLIVDPAVIQHTYAHLNACYAISPQGSTTNHS